MNCDAGLWRPVIRRWCQIGVSPVRVRVLGNGSITLPMLDESVRAWVAEQQLAADQLRQAIRHVSQNTHFICGTKCYEVEGCVGFCENPCSRHGRQPQYLQAVKAYRPGQEFGQ